MMIELLCRYSVPQTKDSEKAIENELRIQRIIQGVDMDEESERERIMKELGLGEDTNYEYGEFCFNLKDVMAFNRIDKQHTVARFFNNSICVFKVDYDSFKDIYQEETGMIIKCIMTDDLSEDDGEILEIVPIVITED